MPRKPSSILLAANVIKNVQENGVDPESLFDGNGAEEEFDHPMYRFYQDIEDRQREIKEKLNTEELSEEETERLSNITGALDYLKDSIKSTFTNTKDFIRDYYNQDNPGMNLDNLKEASDSASAFIRDLEEIKKDFPEEAEQEYFKSFDKDFTPDKYSDNTIKSNNRDPNYKYADIIEASGEKKSAAKWIEEAREKLKKDGYESDLDAPRQFARIIAARQLGNAVRGKKQNIVNNMITEGQLEERAAELMEDQCFQDFMKSMDVPEVREFGADRGEFDDKGPDDMVAIRNVNFDDRKYLKFLAGHCGALEDKLGEHVAGRVDSDELVDNGDGLYGRYAGTVKEQNKYATYSQYIADNLYPSIDTRIRYEKDVVPKEKSVKLYAAFELGAKSRKVEENGKEVRRGYKFNAAALEARTQQLLKDPLMMIMIKDPKYKQMLDDGQFHKFKAASVDVMKQFTPAKDNYTNLAKNVSVSESKVGMEALKILYEKLLGPNPNDPKKYKKYLAGRSPEYRRMVNAVGSLINKGDSATQLDRVKTLGTVLKYQEGKEQIRTFKGGRERFDLSMQVGLAVTRGTPAAKIFDAHIDDINEMRGPKAQDNPEYRVDKYELSDVFNRAKDNLKAELAPEADAEVKERDIDQPVLGPING
ncbi:MAG: hypothetical protein IKN24_03000 [Lachnospiraceae bacterium]|nr:hypothetical protein [Lachnospiraceae bacterium]